MAEKNNKREFTLSDGTKVVADLTKNTGRTLIKARKASNFCGTAIFMMAFICTFDNKTKTPDELLDKDVSFVMEIESIWEEINEKK